jgi:hypothetical protein
MSAKQTSGITIIFGVLHLFVQTSFVQEVPNICAYPLVRMGWSSQKLQAVVRED